MSDGPDLRPAGWDPDRAPSAADPDLRPVGWVTEQPGVTVERTRLTGWLIGGVVLLVVGAGALGLGILAMVADTGPADDEVVAEGVIAGLDGPDAATARFTAGGDDPFTIWLDNDGLGNSVVREEVVAATECTAGLPGGDRAEVRGSRQGNSVVVDDWSTIGWFSAAEGTVEVTCRQVEHGLRGNYRRLRDEHAFIVERGKPSFPVAGMVGLSVGILALLAGAFAVARGVPGRLRRVR